MKISIITVSYNSALTIRETIESVLSQQYDNLEYIIIDGGSRDDTLDIIRSYGNRIQVVVSGPDKGIYDAMNKGISKASGDVIGILNSDDIYGHSRVLKTVSNTFRAEGCDAVYGNIVMISNNLSKTIRTWRAGRQKAFTWGWHPPHPSLFVKKSIYDSYGLFKIQYKISADFELMLRFFEKARISAVYIDDVFVKMRMGGASTGSLRNIMIGNVNIRRAFRENGIKYYWIYPFIRIIKKLLQFI